MKTAAEMYPEYAKNEAADGRFYGPSDYAPIIEALGEVLIREDDNDYQGDTYALVKGANGRLGYVTIGWGSCSGCDALQGCNSLAELDALASGIADGVTWFDDEAAARVWFEAHDWQAAFGWRAEAATVFTQKVWALLGCAGEPPKARDD